jgi:hypothetical protein
MDRPSILINLAIFKLDGLLTNPAALGSFVARKHHCPQAQGENQLHQVMARKNGCAGHVLRASGGIEPQ